VPRQRVASTEGRASFRRYVLDAAMTGVWLAWAEFADRAHRDLVRSVPPSRDVVKRAQAWAQKERDVWLADEREIREDRTPRGIDTFQLRFMEPEDQARYLKWCAGERASFIPLSTKIPAHLSPGDLRRYRLRRTGEPNPVSDEAWERARKFAQADIDEWERHYSLPPEERAPTVEELTACRLRDLAATVNDSVQKWRKCRAPVLAELGELGLAATVERTDQAVPVEEHEADLAGLVRLHLPSDSDSPRGDPPQTDYEWRMARIGLVPCRGLPKSLRGFCGQFTAPIEKEPEPSDYVPPNWLDHAHTWINGDGDLVLIAEPYEFDPLNVVQDLQHLPLTLDGPYPGVWNDGTTQLALLWNPDADVLAAEHRPPMWCDTRCEWVQPL
jgi:hypothetical protein